MLDNKLHKAKLAHSNAILDILNQTMEKQMENILRSIYNIHTYLKKITGSAQSHKKRGRWGNNTDGTMESVPTIVTNEGKRRIK